MDFFTRQEAARRRTSLLVLYFCVAVVLIVFAVYAILALVFLRERAASGADWLRLWDPRLFMATAFGVLAVVATGSLFKISALRMGGGSTVAESLGGRLIPTDTQEFTERRLLNVVEEMALASGIPCPPVYLLPDETGINAFAAGYTKDDAVVGITRGAVAGLTRDELQGVIAHEFSHVLNGDMRLNIRLIGALHGILLLAIIGRIILYSVGRGRMRSRDDNRAGMAILALGASLLVLGSIGVFFGRLIKAAVSRQREFLADASAVQFTRNPSGLGGALKKIGGLVQGSRLATPKAEQASHMYFANGLAGGLSSLFSTHPDLTERIRRIEPEFDGKFESLTLEQLTRSSLAADRPKETAAARATRELQRLRPVLLGAVAAEPERVLETVGAPMREHVDAVHALLQDLPPDLHEAAHQPFGARAVVYALLIDDVEEVRAQQLEILRRHADPAVFAATERLAPAVGELRRELRIPLVELAISALRTLTAEQYGVFKENVERLTRADNTIELFEYALRALLFRHLDALLGAPRRGLVRFRSVRAVAGECNVVLTLLARVGHDDEAGAEAAFRSALPRLGPDWSEMELLSPEAARLEDVDRALAKLNASSPEVKKKLLAACLTCLGHDGEVRVEEFELFRAVADALDCPVPPALATGIDSNRRLV